MKNTTIQEVLRILKESPKKGSFLELTIKELLSDMGFTDARVQLSGTQFGFDISAMIQNPEGHKEIWKIECKNLNRPITLSDIAPKLVWHTTSSTIDVFVIASTSLPSNDLLHFLENHPYSFPIMLWAGEGLAALIASSTRTLASLGISSPQNKRPDSTTVFLPAGPLAFDVVHQHNPPRQFAYFKIDDKLIKSYTDLEFKLQLLFGNRQKDDLLVNKLQCLTNFYCPIPKHRVICQTKAKGIFEPEKIRFTPSVTSGSIVDLFESRMLTVSTRITEAVLAELDINCTPGYYEIQFIAHSTSTKSHHKILSPIFPLLIRGGGEDIANVQVYGKHYDEPVSCLLDLPEEKWRLIAGQRNSAEEIVWLGPYPDEILRGEVKSTWQLRSQVNRLHADNSATLDSTTLSPVVDLMLPIKEELYSVKMANERVAGTWEPYEWLTQQLSRRRRIVTKEQLNEKGM